MVELRVQGGMSKTGQQSKSGGPSKPPTKPRAPAPQWLDPLLRGGASMAVCCGGPALAVTVRALHLAGRPVSALLLASVEGPPSTTNHSSGSGPLIGQRLDMLRGALPTLARDRLRRRLSISRSLPPLAAVRSVPIQQHVIKEQAVFENADWERC